MKNCTICGNALNDYLTVYDDRHGYPGQFQLSKCTNCGHKSLQASFTQEELTRLYTDYYPGSSYDIEEYQPFKEVSGFHAWFYGESSFAFRWVPKNVRVLDIGCGFGEALGYHKARGCDVYGVEADENIRRVADRFDYNVHVGLFDSANYEPDFFDYVTLDQVMEHVTNPVETLQGIARVMKPGGKLILSTPNSNGWGARMFGRRWVHWHAPYHLQFFSKTSLKLAAEQAGLIVEDVKIITSSDWLYFQWIHLVTLHRMGEPSVFWTPNMNSSSLQKFGMTVVERIHRTKLDHILTLFFDALGIGDNYMFFLRKDMNRESNEEKTK